MNAEVAQEFMKIAAKHSPDIFINYNLELIVIPRNNIYFRLKDVESKLDLQRKVIEWLSRGCHTGVSNPVQKKLRNICNDYLGTSFTKEEFDSIYTYLGNGVDSKATIKFIESGFNLNVIDKLMEGAS
ncbi:hypothetical protein [Marinilactibacillus sp. Marseille-P9653]|uniref:hypothetical protein n=1 Tax=Marinilactibacillus sp. Marseille-P9653 TaxID=2866583 RepID=UPI001CE3ED9D|nr:hypothetical protein [Marinilactibacillus sp. Marseille-P9653]